MEDQQAVLDYIDQYHEGKVSDLDFKARLATDKLLQKEFAKYEEALRVIESSVTQKLRAKSSQLLKAHEEQEAPSSNKNLKWILLIIVLCLASVATVYLMQSTISNQSPDQLFANYFELAEVSSQRGLEEDSNLAIWAKALDSYQKGDYSTYLSEFSSLQNIESFKFSNEASLYAGLSNIMLNQSEVAIESLKQVSKESSYYPRAEWYLSLIYLKIDDRINAEKLLKRISKNKRHYKSNEAKEILHKL